MERQSPTSVRYRTRGDTTLIELRLNESRQLFDNRDPAPFINRDLDSDAVEYIVGAVSELRRTQKFELVMHFQTDSPESLPDSALRDAIHSFFAYQAQLLQSRRLAMFRRARFAMILGITVLILTLTLANLIRMNLPPGLINNIASEGFSILGWVALWKPFELIFYDWWQLYENQSLHQRLAACPISIEYPKKS